MPDSFGRTPLYPSASLTLDQLACSKGGRELFRQVSAQVDAGQWLYVTGANGVGKTSLLRMICGLAPVEAGDIRWCEQSTRKQKESYQQALCYLGHLNALQESMTVDENVRFLSALHHREPSATQRQQVLGNLGLRGRSRQLVRHLSQGQKRRVALSRLLLSQARLWVLDEPYVAMDDAGIQMLARLIGQHLGQGGLAVLTSHQRVPIGDIAPQLLELKSA
jgi:heme exporter protein A